MAIPIVQDLDLGGISKLKGALLDPRASAPSSPGEGQSYFNTVSKVWSYWDGTSWVTPGAGSITSIVGTSPVNTNTASGVVTISIDAASGSGPGSMSSAHYTLVNGATDSASNNTLVKRDGSGNFSANVITASLTGTASNASQLNGQNASYYLARGNHTGTQLANTISDLATTVQGYALSAFAIPTSPVSFNSQRLTNLGTPTAAADAATKGYVDAARQGLDFKDSVRVATTASIDLSAPGTTIDGVTLATGDRVLVKDQAGANQKYNGIYVFDTDTTSMTRSYDADTSAEVTTGMFVYVEEGTLGGSQYVMNAPGPIVLDTTALTFALYSGAGNITTGNGISKTGNTLSADVDNATIDFTGTHLEVKALGIDTAQLKDSGVTGAKLANSAVDLAGAKITGTLGVGNGGTGGTTAAAARSNLGATTKYSTLIGDGSSTTLTVTHNLNTRDVTVLVRENSGSYRAIIVEVDITSVNTVDIVFATPPTTNQYSVIVIA